jgi:lipopolysaccharide transport system ATP-binding protein
VSAPAIRAERLGKQYVLGEGRPRYFTLRESLAEAVRRRWPARGRRGPHGAGAPRDLWALRDVSFEIAAGESVGIIGRNGAGKSTLLKILSRITGPTEGRAEIRGRVGALLEVGTGFHPELTGRENILLSGAILGMRRAEIRARFDAIVAFAEVDRFLDTPVKRYSSGMYLRLAFAVAAHLNPEILLVDEVLAVGDVEFQRKCVGLMDDVARQGRTVLVVSHHMGTIERLCGRCLLLRGGRVARIGPTAEVVREYVAGGEHEKLEWRLGGDPPAGPHLRRISVCDASGAPVTAVTSNSVVGIAVECVVPEPRPALQLGICILDARGQAVFSTGPLDDGKPYPAAAGVHRYRALFPGAILMPQRYSVTVSLYDPGGSLDHRPEAVVIDVVPVASMANLVDGGRPGVLQIGCAWTHEVEPARAAAGKGRP